MVSLGSVASAPSAQSMNNGMQIPMAARAGIPPLPQPPHATNPNGSTMPMPMLPPGCIILANGMVVHPQNIQQPPHLPLANISMSSFGSNASFHNSGSSLLSQHPADADTTVVPISKRTFATSNYKRF